MGRGTQAHIPLQIKSSAGFGWNPQPEGRRVVTKKEVAGPQRPRRCRNALDSHVVDEGDLSATRRPGAICSRWLEQLVRSCPRETSGLLIQSEKLKSGARCRVRSAHQAQSIVVRRAHPTLNQQPARAGKPPMAPWPPFHSLPQRSIRAGCRATASFFASRRAGRHRVGRRCRR